MPPPRRPSYRLLAKTLAELGKFLRESATSVLGLPGRIRFRMIREADKAEDLARRALENGDDKNGDKDNGK